MDERKKKAYDAFYAALRDGASQGAVLDAVAEPIMDDLMRLINQYGYGLWPMIVIAMTVAAGALKKQLPPDIQIAVDEMVKSSAAVAIVGRKPKPEGGGGLAMRDPIEREDAIRAVEKAVGQGLAATAEDLKEVLEGLPRADDDSVEAHLLRYCRDGRVHVAVYTINGGQIHGVIAGYDDAMLMIRVEDRVKYVYRHAVSTIVPEADPTKGRNGDVSNG